MIKRFVSYYRPHIKLFILDMFSSVVVAVCTLFYPQISRELINGFEEGTRDASYLIHAALFLLGVYIVKAIFQYIIGYWGHVVGVRMQRDMRRDLFAKYQRLPTSYFDDHKTGDLLSRITNDLFDVSELAHHGPEDIFLSILMLVGSFIVLSGIDLTLTLIMFSVIPLIVLFTALSRKKMRAAMKNSRVQMADINSTLENSLTGIRETKAKVAEHHEICKFNASNEL